MRWVNFLEGAREARRGARAEWERKVEIRDELERKGPGRSEERERSERTFSETVLVRW